MIFGGYDEQGYSAVTTEIWSMERQVWIEGPYLPVQEAVFACGVPINRTHGIVFIERNLEYENCIDAYIYSVETFAWVSIKKCVIGTQ